MGSSTPLRSKVLSNTRSSSLPSRSHPLIPQFNDHLHKLNNTISTPSSLPSISKKLHDLDSLYTCLDTLLLLPHTRQVFTRDQKEKWAEEISDGYLHLIDSCSTAKDLISQSKEHVLDLLSILRRRVQRDSDDDLSVFLSSRKAMRKTMQKSLRHISSFKNKVSILALDKDQETIAIVSMLREVRWVTLGLIEALLRGIGGAAHSRLGGWSFVSRLMQIRRVSDRDRLEFGDQLDAALCRLVGFRTSSSKCDVADELQGQLREMDESIRDVEERVECLFKRLIKTRVSLLNMHSQ